MQGPGRCPAKAGVTFVDAPVSGGPRGAREGTIANRGWW